MGDSSGEIILSLPISDDNPDVTETEKSNRVSAYSKFCDVICIGDDDMSDVEEPLPECETSPPTSNISTADKRLISYEASVVFQCLRFWACQNLRNVLIDLDLKQVTKVRYSKHYVRGIFHFTASSH